MGLPKAGKIKSFASFFSKKLRSFSAVQPLYLQGMGW
jgi:hypothetical protein